MLRPTVPTTVTASAYADIETTVASAVGLIEVYKVHHHGSRYSSNANWLAITSPKVGVISMSNSNPYGHPTAEALSRLHNAGARTYWTSVGNGALPVPGLDVIAGNVIVEVGSGATSFTVRHATGSDLYPMWGFGAPSGLPLAAPFGSV